MKKFKFNRKRKNLPVLNRKKDSLGRKASTGRKGLNIDWEDPGILLQVEMLAQLGATIPQMADFFMIHPDTMHRKFRKYNKLYEAKQRGGVHADMKVAHSLYKRAVGYEYDETKIKERKLRDKHGNETGWVIIEREVVHKTVVPDVKAQQSWLRTRRRDVWSEVGYKLEGNININHSGEVEHTIKKAEDIPVDDLSKETQKMLYEIVGKQLDRGVRDN